MIDFLNKYNLGKKKLIGIGIFIALFLIALPLTLIQVQKQQEIKQHAAEIRQATIAANSISLGLSPTKQTIGTIGENFSVDLNLNNPNNKNISAVDVTLIYNSDLLVEKNASVLEGWSFVYNNNEKIPGKMHYTLINTGDSLHIGSTVPLIRFYLNSKKQGTANINVSNVLVTAINDSQPLATSTPNNKLGSYTIGEELQSITPSHSQIDGDLNGDGKINQDDVNLLISHYGDKGGIFDLNGDGIVDGTDYNILLRLTSNQATISGNSNPATVAFIDFIEGSLGEELEPLLPKKVDLTKELPAIANADIANWKKAVGILGVTISPVTELLNDFSLVYLWQKESRIKDLTQQITIYDIMKDQVEKGRSIDDVLNSYKQLVEVYQGRVLMSNKGKAYLDNKYNSMLNAYKEKCKTVDELKKAHKKPNAEDEGACLFPALAEADIDTLEQEEARLIKDIGNPEWLLIYLASYDKVTREGNDGLNYGLNVYYQLARRFDDKKEFGSAIKVYDLIATNAPSSEIGKASKARIEQLHSFGHQGERVFFHIGASLSDPTGILPINMCGPESIGCRLVGKVLLKPGIVTKNVARFGTEKVTQFLITSYGLRREAADAVIEASSKLAKDETGGIKFGELFGKSSKAVVKILTDEEAKAFRKDITDFIIEEKYPTRNHSASIETFFQYFPQYKNYSLEELKKNLPEYINISVRSKIMYVDLLFEKAFGKFLYRGEGSQVAGTTPKRIVDLLEVFNKQGGIGGTTNGSFEAIQRTYVAIDPHYAINYTLTHEFKPGGQLFDEVRGVWVIKKSVLELEDLSSKYETTGERAIKGVIPFQYVEKLSVTEKVRQQILQKYGAENTQLFGRPIKDVVIGNLNSELDESRDALIKAILELNLEAPK